MFFFFWFYELVFSDLLWSDVFFFDLPSRFLGDFFSFPLLNGTPHHFFNPSPSFVLFFRGLAASPPFPFSRFVSLSGFSTNLRLFLPLVLISLHFGRPRRHVAFSLPRHFGSRMSFCPLPLSISLRLCHVFSSSFFFPPPRRTPPFASVSPSFSVADQFLNFFPI